MTMIPSMRRLNLALSGVTGSRETNIMTMISGMHWITYIYCWAGPKETSVYSRSTRYAWYTSRSSGIYPQSDLSNVNLVPHRE